MDKAEIYVGYPNSTNGATLVNLVGSGHEVEISKNQHAVGQTVTEKTSNPKVKFAFSFCRPITISGGQSITESTLYIYAASSDIVSTPDTATADIPMHIVRGSD